MIRNVLSTTLHKGRNVGCGLRPETHFTTASLTTQENAPLQTGRNFNIFLGSQMLLTCEYGIFNMIQSTQVTLINFET